MSWLLRVYLESMIGHLSLMAPSVGAVTTTTTHSCVLGGGVSFSEGSKTLVEWLKKLSTKEQKQAPENSTGVF